MIGSVQSALEYQKRGTDARPIKWRHFPTNQMVNFPTNQMASIGKVKRANPTGKLNALAGQERQDEIDKALGDLRVEYLEHRHFNLAVDLPRAKGSNRTIEGISRLCPLFLWGEGMVSMQPPIGDVAINSRA